jgi:hypothetical protein
VKNGFELSAEIMSVYFCKHLCLLFEMEKSVNPNSTAVCLSVCLYGVCLTSRRLVEQNKCLASFARDARKIVRMSSCEEAVSVPSKLRGCAAAH